jgi:16S rRNA (guanine966-N2)-methyltransferase
LLAPAKRGLRPTSDRVREALFSILAGRVEGGRFLDLFAGTGAVGIEALSRGAARVTFVEPDPAALRVLRANLARCGMEPRARVHPVSSRIFLRRPHPSGSPFDIVFADPPYQSEAWRHELTTLSGRMITSGTLLVVEHATRSPAPDQIGALVQRRQYRYGDTTLTFFSVGTEGTSSQ